MEIYPDPSPGGDAPNSWAPRHIRASHPARNAFTAKTTQEGYFLWPPTHEGYLTAGEAEVKFRALLEGSLRLQNALEELQLLFATSPWEGAQDNSGYD